MPIYTNNRLNQPINKIYVKRNPNEEYKEVKSVYATNPANTEHLVYSNVLNWNPTFMPSSASFTSNACATNGLDIQIYVPVRSNFALQVTPTVWTSFDMESRLWTSGTFGIDTYFFVSSDVLGNNYCFFNSSTGVKTYGRLGNTSTESLYLRGICYYANNFYIVGGDSSKVQSFIYQIPYSSLLNPESWLRIDNTVTNRVEQWGDVAANSTGILLAPSLNGNSSYNFGFYYAPTQSWGTHVMGIQQRWLRVFCGNDTFISFDNYSRGSRNLAVWIGSVNGTPRIVNLPEHNSILGDITFGNGRFVIVGSGGISFESFNGLDWTKNTLNLNYRYNQITYRSIDNTFITVPNNTIEAAYARG